MPVSNAYIGRKLFDVKWASNDSIVEVKPNYVESHLILNDIFPKDKPIFLMCGGGGYSHLTRVLLVYLGWDKNLIYSTGGNWGYMGPNSENLLIEPEGVLATWRANYASYNLRSLTNVRVFASPNLQYVSPEVFYRALLAVDTNDRQLVDIRTRFEFDEHRIPGAINIDIKAAGFREKIDLLDKDKPIFIYCLRSIRTVVAIEILQELGFKEIYELDGGLIAWHIDNMPIYVPPHANLR
jgi:rhodanese-related sulfurtransferase